MKAVRLYHDRKLSVCIRTEPRVPQNEQLDCERKACRQYSTACAGAEHEVCGVVTMYQRTLVKASAIRNPVRVAMCKAAFDSISIPQESCAASCPTSSEALRTAVCPARKEVKTWLSVPFLSSPP